MELTPDSYAMTFLDSYEQAVEYSRHALDQMAQLDVPATPCNFTIWYTHVSGREPDLSHMITVLKGNNREFTDDVCNTLFVKFFSHETEGLALSQTTAQIEGELQRIIEYVDEAGSGASAYGQSLVSAQSNFKNAKDASSLKGALTKVISDTHKMQTVNKTLETKLAASTREVGKLRVDLEEMRKEALTDALTGIANRKQFDIELRLHARDAMENGEPLSLLIIDIDHFKAFNDKFGHQTGDEVLKLLAVTMTKAVKGTDVPARYGGEEFVIILPRANLDGARKVAETIREQISLKRMINRNTGQNLGRITVSIGTGQFLLGEPLGNFIKRADQALYKAKAAGRNQVVSQDDLKSSELTFQ